MKKILTIGLSLFLLFNACSKDDDKPEIKPDPDPVVIAVKELKLDKTSISLIKGKETQLTCTVLPENAENKEITWKSSNPDVATVSNTGLVIAIEKGTCDITATSNNDIEAKCNVNVSSVEIKMPVISNDKDAVKNFLASISDKVDEVNNNGYCKLSCTPKVAEENIFTYLSYEFIYENSTDFSELNFTYKLRTSPEISEADLNKLNELIDNIIIKL